MIERLNPKLGSVKQKSDKILAIPAKEKIGKRLQKFADRLCREKGLRYKDIADIGKIADATFSDYVTGKQYPKSWALFAWANSLGLDLNWLATGEGGIFQSEKFETYPTNRWADQIQETVEGYTHGLSPLSQIMSALWHTVGEHIEPEGLHDFQGKIQAKDKEPGAAEVHQQAAKELYELKATLEQTDMDPEDRKTLYRHVVHKYYDPVSGATGGIPVENLDSSKEEG